MVKGPFGESLYFSSKIPKSLLSKKNTFWIIDKEFSQKREFEKIKNKIFVKAGENLKTIDAFTVLLRKLIKAGVTRDQTLIAVGGGSVGDAAGFLSSVYLRGLKLIHVPTTWLSAVDSSVGAKTALNFYGHKNQIGTFYPPESIYYIKSLIRTSSLSDAQGEIVKTLILNKNKIWAKNLNNKLKIKFEDLNHFIKYKTAVVKKDSRDKKNIRAILNLGHTMGHAFELELGCSHGEAVLYGLKFSLCWSFKKGLIKSSEFTRLSSNLPPYIDKILKLPVTKIRKNLLKDKKVTSDGKVNFVFVSTKRPLVKKVTVDEILNEFKRQVHAV